MSLKLSLDLETVYRTYIKDISDYSKSLNALNLDWDINQPKFLRILVLDEIIKLWIQCPEYFKIEVDADKIYFFENLDTYLPLDTLSKHITDNRFWKRCYLSRWPSLYPNLNEKKKWITYFMEKYLSEIIENLDPCDYNQEEMHKILEISSQFITKLNISYLQPSMSQGADHIPFDYILSNLSDLKILQITYDAKNISTNYYLGCCTPSKHDVTYLCRGLQKCYELIEFKFYNTKLEPFILINLGRALEKGCSNIQIFAIPHCRITDSGVKNFIIPLNKDSFSHLQHLDLTNNLLSQEAALCLSRILLNRKLKSLILRMNPIGSDGAAAILSILSKITTLEYFDIGACSITNTIERILLKLLIENKSIINFDISNNDLGEELGKNIYKIVGFNKIIKYLDLRNTEISNQMKSNIEEVLLENRNRNKSYSF